MRLSVKVIITCAILLLVLWELGSIGVSVLLAPSGWMMRITTTHPWAPWCIAVVCILMAGLAIIGAIGFLMYQANK